VLFGAAVALSLGCSKNAAAPAADAGLKTDWNKVFPEATGAEGGSVPQAQDSARLADVLERGASGAETTSGVAGLFDAQEADGYEVKNTTPSVLGIEQGLMTFKERKIPAGVLKASFVAINRSEGAKRIVCVYQLGGYDAEFQMWRSLKTVSCDATDAWKRLAAWKDETGFTLTAKSGDALPAPPPGTPVVEVVQRNVRHPESLCADARGAAWFTVDEADYFTGRLWVSNGTDPPQALVDRESLGHLVLVGDSVVASRTTKRGSHAAGDYELIKVNRSSGERSVVAPAQDIILDVAARGDTIYWTTAKEYSASESRLMKMDLAAADSRPTAVVTIPFPGASLVVDGDLLRIHGYRHDGTADKCRYAEVKDGVLVASRSFGSGGCYVLTVDGDRTFVGTPDSEVLAFSKNGGKGTSLGTCPNALLLGGGSLCCASDKGIYRLDLADGSTKVLASDQKTRWLARSDNYLFWTLSGDDETPTGGVYRLKL
jgi:hypothetical protein